MIDLVASDSFNMVALTTAINKLPFQPTRIGSMGLFADDPISTTTFMVEEYNGVLALIPNTQRGAPPKQAAGGTRKTRTFACTHLPYERTLRAEDIQGVRAFGTGTELQTIASIVNGKLQEMKNSHSATLEHLRIGALQGNILDADGVTVIYNLFTEFGVTEGSTDFALGTAGTDVLGKCMTVKRATETALGASLYDHIHCFCGATWFDKFVSHANVKDAYKYWSTNQMLRQDNRKGFEFGGIFFEEYPGSVGGVSFLDASSARFFPVGVPDLFKTHYAPADFIETANTLGLPMYAKQELQPFGRGVNIHTQSNPLPMCHIPLVLQKGTTSN
jgi:hypothetical protein